MSPSTIKSVVTHTATAGVGVVIGAAVATTVVMRAGSTTSLALLGISLLCSRSELARSFVSPLLDKRIGNWQPPISVA